MAVVQAAYVLMDREVTTSKAEQLIGSAAAAGARLIVSPEVFVPGTPIWIDAVLIWEAGGCVVVGVDEREPHGTTIYNTILYFGPDGQMIDKHRKLMPTGSERTV